jgi:exopolysaccharide production protein ExoY
LAALTALLPLFVVVSVAVLLSGGSPLIFKQTRVGKGGRVFKILKFRTMVRDAEKILQCRPDLLDEYHRTYKIQNDPRITTVGRFLRSTTLDELPQFINVVLGDMSLVGPRPIVPSELALYGDCQDTYLSMKPGCAGLWQCSGRSDLSYGERVALDVTYHRKASIAYDLRILLLTLVSVFGRKGAN